MTLDQFKALGEPAIQNAPDYQLRLWIAQFITRYPKRNGYSANPPMVLKGEPIWINGAGNPATCPKYDKDLGATFEMVRCLSVDDIALSHQTAPGRVEFRNVFTGGRLLSGFTYNSASENECQVLALSIARAGVLAFWRRECGTYLGD